MNQDELKKSSRKEKRSAQKTLGGKISDEISRVIIGQEQTVELMVISLLCSGHILLTGLPGLAKTLMIKTVARLFDFHFNRIQFTPDLMPSDLTGFELLDTSAGGGQMKFVSGPVFTNILLADEVNRTPPKTQAALLQAMQEHQVTVMGKHYDIAQPFMVMATQNPLEQEGTYPLPEAQLDRFLFKLDVGYPDFDAELKIMTDPPETKLDEIRNIVSKKEFAKLQKEVLAVHAATEVREWIVKLIQATRPQSSFAINDVKSYVTYGASPRASLAVLEASRAAAYLDGEDAVRREHIEKVLKPVLRHRLYLNFAAHADGVTSDRIIEALTQIAL